MLRHACCAYGVAFATRMCMVVQANPGKQLWHTPRVKFAGLPEGTPWPSREQLTSVLHTRPGRAVATQVCLYCHLCMHACSWLCNELHSST